MRTRTRTGAASLAAVLLLTVGGLAACSSDSGTSTGDPKTEGSGTLEGAGRELVYFTLATSNVYAQSSIKGAQQEADELGFDLRVISPSVNDPSEVSKLVEQYLSTNPDPAAILWWPVDSEAGANDVRQLSRVAPVIQVDTPVTAGAAEYVTAYAGADQGGIGAVAGKLASEARDDVEASGKKLHSENGNLLEFSFFPGFDGSTRRTAEFGEATAGRPFNTLASEPAGFDAQSGFAAATPLVSQYADQIDFVFAHSVDVANGVIRALNDNGLKAGKDVTVIAGNCAGDLTPLADGTIYAAVIQPPVLEGILGVRVAAQYLATGDVLDGEFTYEADPEMPELKVEAPHKENYLPAAPIRGADAQNLTVWGYSGSDLCS